MDWSKLNYEVIHGPKSDEERKETTNIRTLKEAIKKAKDLK